MSLYDLRRNQAWRQLAACLGMDTALFYPPADNGKSKKVPAEARAACNRCPVRQACLDYANQQRDKHGYWGGMAPKERAAARRAKSNRVAPCSTGSDER